MYREVLPKRLSDTVNGEPLNENIPPSCNGQVERFNRTIVDRPRNYISDHPNDWEL